MTEYKHALGWFEDRVGKVIYRKPIFAHEQNLEHVALKIKDARHAKTLFELQRKQGSKQYFDSPNSGVYRLSLSARS